LETKTAENLCLDLGCRKERNFAKVSNLLFFRRPVLYLGHIFPLSLQKTSSSFQNRFTIPLFLTAAA
ncbi:hypothetical protein, partial [Neisseria subflava]|uniref:hypothetical protein n=1 Tax=Neisseria subflava TaxID=28449 RepID=UPI0027DE148C